MTTTDSIKLTDTQLTVVATIVSKCGSLGHELRFVHPVSTGPLVTTYRFEPRGVAKVAQITSLTQDIAMALKVEDVLIRRIPGESCIGFTVPNASRSIPLWRDSIVHIPNTHDNPLPLNMGVDSLGRPFVDDLTKCPHLLIAGSTDTGKSVLLRSMIASMIYSRTPDEVQFVMSDTKQVEFGDFVGAPHLIFEPCASKYQTLERMDWLLENVDLRLKAIGAAGYRNVSEFNQAKPTMKFPYIILAIDELADILSAGGERGESKIAESKLSRIVQKSRAAGIHVIAATQRPSVNVVSGSIKANFPSRLSFRLPADTDSRTVLGQAGAEHLLSRGDMLYSSPNRASVIRLHSAYASKEDVQGACQVVKMKFLMENNK